MRGPGACPRGGATILPHGTPTNRRATRTSTRPPPCPTSAPCPYRTPFGRQHSSGVQINLSKCIIASLPPCISHYVRTTIRKTVREIEVHRAFGDNGATRRPDRHRDFVGCPGICLGNRYHNAIDIQGDTRLRANGHHLL